MGKNLIFTIEVTVEPDDLKEYIEALDELEGYVVDVKTTGVRTEK